MGCLKAGPIQTRLVRVEFTGNSRPVHNSYECEQLPLDSIGSFVSRNSYTSTWTRTRVNANVLLGLFPWCFNDNRHKQNTVLGFLS